jgi:hypothetical protein
MKWEYWVEVLNFPSAQGLEDALNEAGEKGWELVSVIQDKEDDAYTFFYKRQKPT